MRSQFEPEEGHDRSARVESTESMERYLDAFCRPLAEGTSTDQYAETRDELRSHLSALAEAYEELGSTPEAAMRLALKKFGDAQDLGIALGQEHAYCSQSFIARVGLTFSGLIGGFASWIALFELEQLYLSLGIFQVGSELFSTPHWLAFGFGLVSGLFVWRGKTTPLRAAAWSGIIGMTIILCTAVAFESYNARTLPGYRPFPNKLLILQGTGLVTAVASAGAGAASVFGTWLRRLGPRRRRASAS
jgi:hypothetical protein